MKKTIALAMALLPMALFAQNEGVKTAVTDNSSDLVWYAIYGLMGVLLLAIMVLGNVLINMVRITIEKDKVKTAAVLLLMLLWGNLFSQVAPVAQTQPAFNSGANWTMIMAITVLCTEVFVVLVLLFRIRALVDALTPKKEKEAIQTPALRMPRFLDNINASVAVEKEKDILLDHNYDGIRELDNSLPPWWKYSFIISIFWAVGYFSYYHLFGGPSSSDEYNTAMRLSKEQQEEYSRLNAGKVDENTVTLADAAGIDEGKTIFASNCAACHGQKGEGVVGPNLTDNYWLHGGSINDVYKSVKYGWPAKGMKSWQTDLSPVQIKNVVSYVKSLRGTNPPNAKAPQGDLYDEGVPVKANSFNQAAAENAKAKGI